MCSARLTLAVLILLSVGISGCGKSKKALEAEAEQKRVIAEKKSEVALVSELQTRTAQQLKDPSSAQFAKVRLNSDKTALCGSVNAKNAFGGYVGFREFITTKDAVLFKPDQCGTTSVFNMPPEAGTACILFLKANEKEKCDAP